jgi:hypothetical protein
MRREHLLAAGGPAVLVALVTLAHGQSRYLKEALTHARTALMQGKQGYPDALVTQAQAALKQAELARKETPNQHLAEGISLLRTAIEQGKQGKGDAATQTVENALTHLSKSTTPPRDRHRETAGTDPMRTASSPFSTDLRQQQLFHHQPMRNAGVHEWVAHRVESG